MIKIENLVKTFGENQVLKGISGEIETGQVVVVVGQSGSGKSTFLRCLNQMETPTSGKVWIDDLEVTSDRVDQSQLASKVGMVFQSFNLFPHLTVLKNVTIAPIKVNKLPADEVNKQAQELLQRFGLADKADDYPSHLSGGQQQRVAIVRELAKKPSVLLFDEPTSALDPENIGEFEEIVEQLAKDGMTIVAVTHNMSFAKRVADQIWFLDKGVIIAHGSPAEILTAAETNPKLAEFFGREVD